MPSQTALAVNQLTVHYEKQPALFDVSLDVPCGLLVGIIGPNGAGKSTFIKSVLGLLKPFSGKIHFFGQPLSEVRKRIAYVPQKESIDWDFPITVNELVLMGRYPHVGLFRRPKKEDREAAASYLQLVGLEEFGDRQISQLSGGQQQRAFLARALAQEADLYFLDEPFSGIDAATEKVLVDLFQQLRDEGKTVFIVHHELSSLKSTFDWVIMLNRCLVAYGPIDQTLVAENLRATYGHHKDLFDQVLTLSRKTAKGFSA